MTNPAMDGGGSPPPSSLLDPLETKSPPPPSAFIQRKRHGNPEFDSAPASPEEQQFRHSSWVVMRHRTMAALERCHVGEKRCDAFANCGGGAWLYVAAGGDDLTIKCNKCHDRWCLACGRERAGRISANLLTVMSAKTCRFITLTLRHSSTPLKDQLDRLYRSFNALRRRAKFRESVKGGGAFLEVKVGRDGLWHPHLHVICEGTFLAHKTLSAEWHAVTGDSWIVDIRSVKDDGEAASYVAKYLTKPASHDVYSSAEKLDEMIITLRGRRLCMTFGSWRGVVLEPKDDDGVEWKPIASIDSLRSRASAGDEEALRWVAAAARKWPLFAHLLRPPDDPAA
jgi:hypothetical protein